MVYERKVHAAAIDSLVLAVELQQHPELEQGLRVIQVLGPSTIQPFAASSRIAPSLREDVQGVFLEMHKEQSAKEFLHLGLIDHFVAVQDSDYDDIRTMLAACESAGFTALR